MDSVMIARLEKSFNLLAPRGPELVDRFYAQLFSKHPALRPMFPADMSEQKKKLLASLVLVIENIRDAQKLEQPLQDLGARHAGFGAQAEHYPVIRDTLVSVMAEMAGEVWNDQLTQDWNGALDFVSSVMLEGAKSAAPAGHPN